MATPTRRSGTSASRSNLNGRLLLRIEDLDRARCKPQHEAAILEDLAWLGLRFEARPRRQSEHGDDYVEALARLAQLGLLYPCFCSRAEVARSSLARDPDGAPLYAGTCRKLSTGERAECLARGDKVAWRLEMRGAIDAASRNLAWSEFFEETSAAERPAEPALWGDVVLSGRDQAASYHLAVTVDDALQGVTDVVRGRDLLAATAVHRLLQDLLCLPAPRYRHHRLVLGASGTKLSKSHRSPSLSSLRSKGLSATRIRAALGFARGDDGGLAIALS